MEKITNYKFKDFIKLKDSEKVESYLNLLEILNPATEIVDPKFRIGKSKKIKLKRVRDLLFGQVTNIRTNLSIPTIESMIEMIMLVTGLKKKECYSIRILDFYAVLAAITAQIIELSDMEANELGSEESDLDEALANERMAKFGILNIINSLAGDNILRWSEIEKLPYMVVFTKLKMDKEKSAIQKQMMESQKRKTNG